jgi:glycosyltransferase involved in cell wall biosynthesis
MRIAYIVRQIDATGGRERVVINKANYFVEHFGYEVFVITMQQREESPAFALDPRVKVVHLDLLPAKQFSGGLISYYRYVRAAFRKVLLEIRPTFCVSLWWGPEFKVLPFVGDGSTKLLEFHFSNYSRFLQEGVASTSLARRLRLLVTRWVERRLISCYDQFVVLTEEDKADWGGGDIVVIPNSPSFATEERAPCVNRTVLAMGRMAPQKGLDRLIRIWASVAPAFPDWTLKIHGDGPDREQLTALVSTLGLSSVLLLPFSQDPKREMLEASILAMAARYEGFPMVLIEAMQCGLPIVSYDTKCGPREIIDDEVTGYIVREDDEATFAQRLSQLMSDRALRVRLGSAAKATSDAKLSEATIMGRWRTLFESRQRSA